MYASDPRPSFCYVQKRQIRMNAHCGGGHLEESGEAQRIRQTILVVDDAEIIQQTLRSILERLGYRVLAATDAGLAKKLFTQHAPELVLMIVEIGLSIVSGPEFVNRLPTLAPRVPVLFITAMGEWEGDTVRNKFPVLLKPFRADILIATVKTLVSGT